MEVDTQQYEVSDLVRYAYEGQPSKVQDVFNELMMGRVFDSIQQKKVEVAQQFFNPPQEPEFHSDEDYDQEETEDGENS
jgi:hypothetical protein